MGDIDFHSMKKSSIEVNGTYQLFGYRALFKISSFCVQQNKAIHKQLETT